MAAAFERGVHENIEHLFGIAVADQAGRYAKNVGVVMLAGQFGQFFAPADGGPDALVLVGRDGNTVGASAESNSESGFTFFNGGSDGMGKIRVVDRILAVGSEIFKHNALSFEKRNEIFFAVESGVIATDGNR